MFNEVDFFANFELQVTQNPDRTAIAVNDREISFVKLKNESHKLGRQILATRSKLELTEPIPIYADRSLNSAVTIFACFYTGIPFCVVDSLMPSELATQLLAKIGINHPMLDATTDQNLPKDVSISIDIDDMSLPSPSFTDLAVVILTSGSTGIPKGVMHSRYSISTSNYMQNFLKLNHPSSGHVSLSPLSFAMGLGGIFRLAAGVPYFNLDPAKYSLANLVERVNDLGPNSMGLTSQFARVLGSYKGKLKFETINSLSISGEEFRYEYLNRLTNLFDTEIQIRHGLGSTEGGGRIAFEGNFENLPESGLIEMRLQKPETTKLISRNDIDEDVFEVHYGEISCLGYLNNDALNEEKFYVEDSVRWWRAGDLVKRINDNFIFFGRLDDVVKINGYLVSPLTVTNILKTFSYIENCIVLVKKTDIRRELVAFIQIKAGFSMDSFQGDMSEALPPYLIPRDIRILEEFPLTARMKTDKKRLEEML